MSRLGRVFLMLTADEEKSLNCHFRKSAPLLGDSSFGTMSGVLPIERHRAEIERKIWENWVTAFSATPGAGKIIIIPDMVRKVLLRERWKHGGAICIVQQPCLTAEKVWDSLVHELHWPANAVRKA